MRKQKICCPNCKSENLYHGTGGSNGKVWYKPRKSSDNFKCNDCNTFFQYTEYEYLNKIIKKKYTIDDH